MRMKREGMAKRGRIWLVCMALLAVGSYAGERALSQMGATASPKLVCPLSDAQTQDAIQAFAKMVPVFHHKRCANCHGGVDPFKPINHGGGKQKIEDMVVQTENDDGTGTGCLECHNNFPAPDNHNLKKEWKLADRRHPFVGNDGKSLCEMMKAAFFDKEHFVGHMKNDNGGVDFLSIGFAGTRGLNDEGQGGVKDYHPEPIDIMTHDEFVKDAAAWVDAMGGKFQGDKRCGCEPVHFAVRVSYNATINAGPLQLSSSMGPVDIPITFHEDGTYDGTGTLPFSAKGMEQAAGCSAQSVGSMQIKVSGSVFETPAGDSAMHVQLTNISREHGSTKVACPGKSVATALQGGDKMTFEFDLKGADGDWGEAPVQLGPVGNGTVRVQLVDLDQSGAISQ